MEIWKDIKGFEGYYQVSDQGRVKSLYRIDKRNKPVPEKLLTLRDNGKGYLITYLFIDGVRKMFRVHRIVAGHFVPNPKGLPEVNHVVPDKKNNAAINLEWCTRKQNMQHASQENLLKGRPAEIHTLSIKVLDELTGKIYNTVTAAALDTGLSFKKIRNRTKKNERFIIQPKN